jgi:hypothetical protein
MASSCPLPLPDGPFSSETPLTRFRCSALPAYTAAKHCSSHPTHVPDESSRAYRFRLEMDFVCRFRPRACVIAIVNFALSLKSR